MKRVVLVALAVSLIALPVFAGNPSPDHPTPLSFERTVLPDLSQWTTVQEGVYEYRDADGVVHRRSMGSEGLAYDITQIEAELTTMVEAGQELSDGFQARLELLRTLQRFEGSGIQSAATEKGIIVPACPIETAEAHINIYGLALGAEAVASFNAAGCEYWGEGTVFAQTTGSPSQYCTDSASGANWSISCSAVTSLNGGCAKSSAYVHWLDNADRSYYDSDAAQYPEGCGD